VPVPTTREQTLVGFQIVVHCGAFSPVGVAL
jgi:hypothetical protein